MSSPRSVQALTPSVICAKVSTIIDGIKLASPPQDSMRKFTKVYDTWLARLHLHGNEKYKDEHYLECKNLVSALLDDIYELRKNKQSIAFLRKIQQQFLALSKESNDVAFQKALFRAHTEHYSFVLDDETAPNHYIQAHIRILLRAQELNQFELKKFELDQASGKNPLRYNDFNALRNTARLKSKIIEVDNEDIYSYPHKDTLNKINKTVKLTFGDLHGNALKLLHFLIQQNVIDLKKGEEVHYYNLFSHIYQKNINELDDTDKSNIRDIISNIQVINHPYLIQLIGDVFCDRGGSRANIPRGVDTWTLEIIKKVNQELNKDLDEKDKKNHFSIQLSNHDAEFLRGLQCGFMQHKMDDAPFQDALKKGQVNLIKYKPNLLEGQGSSLENLIVLINKDENFVETPKLPDNIQKYIDQHKNTHPRIQIKELVQALEVQKLACNHYLPHLNLVGYHANKKDKCLDLYIHSAAGIMTVIEIAEIFSNELKEERKKIKDGTRQAKIIDEKIKALKINTENIDVKEDEPKKIRLIDGSLETITKVIDTINAIFQNKMTDSKNKMDVIRSECYGKLKKLGSKPGKINHESLNAIIIETYNEFKKTTGYFKFLLGGENPEPVNSRSFKDPFMGLEWLRYYDPKKVISCITDAEGNEYSIYNVHGHGVLPDENLSNEMRDKIFPNVRNIETKLGATGKLHSGLMLIDSKTTSDLSPLQDFAVQLLVGYRDSRGIENNRKKITDDLIKAISAKGNPTEILKLLNQARKSVMEKDEKYNASHRLLKRNQHGSRFHAVLNKIHTGILNRIEEDEINKAIHVEFQDLANLLSHYNKDLGDKYTFGAEININSKGFKKKYKNMLKLMLEDLKDLDNPNDHYLYPHIRSKCEFISSYFNLSRKLSVIKDEVTRNGKHIALMPRELSFYEKHPDLSHALIGVAVTLAAILILGGIGALIYVSLPVTAVPAIVLGAMSVTSLVVAKIGLGATIGVGIASLVGAGGVGAAMATGIGAIAMKIKSLYGWCCCCFSPEKPSAESSSSNRDNDVPVIPASGSTAQILPQVNDGSDVLPAQEKQLALVNPNSASSQSLLEQQIPPQNLEVDSRGIILSLSS